MASLWGRWPLIDKEIIRLDAANLPVYTAICLVCSENRLTRPDPGEYVSETGPRIEAELQAQADAESG